MTELSLGAVVLTALAGGLGAVLRWLLDANLRRRLPTLASLGIINTLGSFLFGLLAGIASSAAGSGIGSASGGFDPAITAVIGTGLLGGFTTFSTVMVEVVKEARGARRGGVLMAGTIGMLALACIVFAGGLALGSA